MTLKNMLRRALCVLAAAAIVFPLAASAQNDWWDYDYNYGYYDSDWWNDQDWSDYYEDEWFDDDWWEDTGYDYGYGMQEDWWQDEGYDYGAYGYPGTTYGDNWFEEDNWGDYDYDYDYGNYYDWNDSDAIGGTDDFGEEGWFDW